MPSFTKNALGAPQITQRFSYRSQIDSRVSPFGSGGRTCRFRSFCFRYNNEPQGLFDPQCGHRTSSPLLFGFSSVTTPVLRQPSHGRTSRSLANSEVVIEFSQTRKECRHEPSAIL